MSDPIRDALSSLKQSILGIANDTAGEAREKLVEFAALAEQVAVDLAAGQMTPEQAQEAVDNLGLATRSALLNAGYVAQERAQAVAWSGVLTAVKLIAALAA